MWGTPLNGSDTSIKFRKLKNNLKKTWKHITYKNQKPKILIFYLVFDFKFFFIFKRKLAIYHKNQK